MKFNWGTGIAIFYTIFAAFIFTMVYKSRSVNHSLVSKEYYAEDLKYQQHYVKLVNTRNLNELPKLIKKADQKVAVQFPQQFTAPKGELWIFSPISDRLDRKVPIQVDSERLQLLPTDKLPAGRYKLKIDWQGDGKDYFSELEFYL
ncbi:MAG: FixH family protein [Saprospiraceae bacterium]